MKTKSPLKPEAIKLLRRVKRHILAEPRRYEQQTWGKNDDIAPCGTAACIAGWVRAIGDNVPLAAVRRFGTTFNPTPKRACELLGVTPAVTRSLFYASPDSSEDVGGWPEPFGSQWARTHKFIREATQRKHQAKIAAERIEHFIRTGE